jgi:hypothetical protein
VVAAAQRKLLLLPPPALFLSLWTHCSSLVAAPSRRAVIFIALRTSLQHLHRAQHLHRMYAPMYAWTCVVADTEVAAQCELLLVGNAPPHGVAHAEATIAQADKEMMLVDGRCGAVAFTASLQPNEIVRVAELRVVDAVLRLLQAQAALGTALPVWLCTTATQSVSHVSTHRHAGLWGLTRACRLEHPMLPAWCVDVRTTAPLAQLVENPNYACSPGGTQPVLLLKREVLRRPRP